MDRIAILGSTSALDLIAAAAGGFGLSYAIVAFGGVAARWASAGLILALALALGALVIAGPWPPLLIAAGLSLLAAPPIHDRLAPAAGTAGARTLAAFGPPAAAIALVVSRLA